MNAIKKTLDGESTLGEVAIDVIGGHVKELIKNLQGLDNFIDSKLEK